MWMLAKSMSATIKLGAMVTGEASEIALNTASSEGCWLGLLEN